MAKKRFTSALRLLEVVRACGRPLGPGDSKPSRETMINCQLASVQEWPSGPVPNLGNPRIEKELAEKRAGKKTDADKIQDWADYGNEMSIGKDAFVATIKEDLAGIKAADEMIKKNAKNKPLNK